ncbi:type IV secretory system conjugative DNA transfer family protein [uncultured Roseobacter sp.]|uniref:type IV secretory system conjugative DNA transfer family protein n=1 Tax=uncultured Roseobacter sp. TaxID=114847 RepID=UPI00261F1B85|nr:hypothetical protein [uncultured Roseobacter sp.]
MRTTNTVTTLGLGFHRYNAPQPFGIKLRDRLSHVYAIGQTGAGKSTLLGNIAMQDAAQGHGFCLIDPHGDLALKLHQKLNQPHLYWEVADPNSPFGYNPLASVSESFRPLVASALIDTLKKQWPEAWGARMEHLLRFAVLALLEQPQADLRDIVKLFVWKGFRKTVTANLSDPQSQFFWQHEFERMNFQNAADGVAPIANKLGAFLAHPVVRKAVCEPDQPLKFRRLMDTGMPLIVNLAKGRLGTDVSNVLGGLLVSTIMHAAFSRHGLPELARKPFFLHVDEFTSYTTTAFASVLSEARKYGLGLTLAHQHIVQADKSVFEAILGNTGTQIVYRLGARDAVTFERELGFFSARDFTNLPNYRACVRLMVDGSKTQAFSASMLPWYQPGRYGGR